MITYEYPFNERIRTLLRLEDLFEKTGYFAQSDGQLEHHTALVTLFEILEVAGRADLKMDLIQELERQRQTLLAYRNNPDISEEALSGALYEIEQSSASLLAMTGKMGQYLRDNDWLMSIRSRAGIPGGTCEFDLPAYHAWQHLDAAARQKDLQRWLQPLGPVAESIRLLLRLLRDSGVPQKMVATAGQYQQMLPQGRTFQLLRLYINASLALIPEISCNRLMVAVRLMRLENDDRLHASADDSMFGLTLCC